jgi:A/G-specific adenine glycosylase
VKEAARVLAQDQTLAQVFEATNDLPWRRARTPYHVFIAEFLLTRTRFDVVARLFDGFIERFPSVESLALADEMELRTLLRPLGLGKRIEFLMKAARHLKNEHQGQIPNTRQQLLQVPGLGLYSATAIYAFAFGGRDVPADVNILRFLARYIGLPMTHPTKGSRLLWSRLPCLSPARQAPTPERVLDFSRLVCAPRRPQCEVCPLRRKCRYYLAEVQPPPEAIAPLPAADRQDT